MDEAIWTCKIGAADRALLPEGADSPLRSAVEDAYREMVGRDADFLFSGWGAELDPEERWAVRDTATTQRELDVAAAGGSASIEDKLAAIAKFCAENEGTFSLVCHGRDGHWSSMCNFGQEAPDSPMVAGSALGSGDTAEEAVNGVVSDLKLEVVSPDVVRDAAAAEEGAGC